MDELIESIYKAAYQPELWQGVMQDLARSMHAACATMLHRDTASAEGPSTDVVFGVTPAQIASYAGYFRTVDLRFNDANRLPIGGVLADDYNFDFDEFTKTEIYQDFWKPARLGRGLAGVILKKEAMTSLVSVRREINHQPFTASDIQSFQQLLPHMRRSLYFQSQLQRASVRVEAMSVALDHFPVAVFLLDCQGTVLDHNRAAAELLADPHTPLRIRHQRLIAQRPEDDRKLQEMTRTAVYSLHEVEAAPRFLRLPLLDDLRVLTLLPVPINRSLYATTNNCVLLFCRETAASFVDPARLRQQFGFTSAESLVAAAIAEGITLEEFAGKRAVSVGTARQQLKSAMVKAEVHTQAQLASTILRSLTTLVRGS